MPVIYKEGIPASDMIRDSFVKYPHIFKNMDMDDFLKRVDEDDTFAEDIRQIISYMKLLPGGLSLFTNQIYPNTKYGINVLMVYDDFKKVPAGKLYDVNFFHYFSSGFSFSYFVAHLYSHRDKTKELIPYLKMLTYDELETSMSYNDMLFKEAKSLISPAITKMNSILYPRYVQYEFFESDFILLDEQGDETLDLETYTEYATDLTDKSVALGLILNSVQINDLISSLAKLNDKLSKLHEIALNLFGDELKIDITKKINKTRVINHLIDMVLPKGISKPIKSYFKTFLKTAHHQEFMDIRQFIYNNEEALEDPETIRKIKYEWASVHMKELNNILQLRKKLKEENIPFEDKLSSLRKIYTKYVMHSFFGDTIDTIPNFEKEIIEFIAKYDTAELPKPKVFNLFIKKLYKSKTFKENINAISPQQIEIDEYTFKIHDKKDPTNIYAGNLCGVCQIIDGQAEDCVLDLATNSNSFLLSISKENKILFIAYAWIGMYEDEKYIIFDSIETIRDYRKNKKLVESEKLLVALQKFRDYAKANFDVKDVFTGSHCLDMNLKREPQEFRDEIFYNRKTGDYYVKYTDAYNLYRFEQAESLEGEIKGILANVSWDLDEMHRKSNILSFENINLEKLVA